MKINRKALAVSFIVTLGMWAIAWGITVDQIWQAAYDATHHSLRITQVSP